MTSSELAKILVALTVDPVLLGLLFLVLRSFVPGQRWERISTQVVVFSLILATVASLGCALVMFIGGITTVSVLELHLTSVSTHSIEILLRLDRLALPFLVMTCVLCTLVASFSRNYLHRDPGHARFFFLVLFFCLGMETIILGGNLEVLFVGWEMIGLSSALLISFFYDRRSTSENSLKAFWAYRVSDTALLLAAILLARAEAHHTLPPMNLPSDAALIVPILIILAAMPKSAQFPFSSWLPRAMEGPTPSSAVFYGGLSVHAGLYLVMRMAHDYSMPGWYYVLLVVIGAATALFGSAVGKVQSDIKGALAYASLTQVGVMFIEVGLGFHTLVIFHFIGHAMLRTYQILSAGGLIHEGRTASARDKGAVDGILVRHLPEHTRQALHIWALNVSLNDGSGPHSLVNKIESLSQWLASLEGKVVETVTEPLRKRFPVEKH